MVQQVVFTHRLNRRQDFNIKLSNRVGADTTCRSHLLGVLVDAQFAKHFGCELLDQPLL